MFAIKKALLCILHFSYDCESSMPFDFTYRTYLCDGHFSTGCWTIKQPSSANGPFKYVSSRVISHSRCCWTQQPCILAQFIMSTMKMILWYEIFFFITGIYMNWIYEILSDRFHTFLVWLPGIHVYVKTTRVFDVWHGWVISSSFLSVGCTHSSHSPVVAAVNVWWSNYVYMC